jgi:hypothetical protein
MFDHYSVTLAAPVAQDGTFTVPYATNRSGGSYAGAYKHKMFVRSLQTTFEAPAGFTVAHSTSMTVTYKGETTLPASSEITLEMQRVGADDNRPENLIIPDTVKRATLAIIDLGSPLAIDVDGICEAQNRTGAGLLELDGAFVVNGVAVLDVPRNVIVDSGGADTAVLTITGRDVYGQTMVEAITLNGTTAVAGKKAFKEITSVHASATVANGAFIGTGDVLGLPVYLPATGYILGDYESGVFDSTIDGTAVAGVATAATATTGDVRGTYDPGVACDGSVAFGLLVVLPDPADKGVAQYAG